MLVESDAIKIACAYVQSRYGPDGLSRREVHAERTNDGWHVSFPWSDVNMLGGEPHVTLDADGNVVDFYSTQ